MLIAQFLSSASVNQKHFASTWNSTAATCAPITSYYRVHLTGEERKNRTPDDPVPQLRSPIIQHTRRKHSQYRTTQYHNTIRNDVHFILANPFRCACSFVCMYSICGIRFYFVRFVAKCVASVWLLLRTINFLAHITHTYSLKPSGILFIFEHPCATRKSPSQHIPFSFTFSNTHFRRRLRRNCHNAEEREKKIAADAAAAACTVNQLCMARVPFVARTLNTSPPTWLSTLPPLICTYIPNPRPHACTHHARRHARMTRRAVHFNEYEWCDIWPQIDHHQSNRAPIHRAQTERGVRMMFVLCGREVEWVTVSEEHTHRPSTHGDGQSDEIFSRLFYFGSELRLILLVPLSATKNSLGTDYYRQSVPFACVFASIL